MLWTPDGRALLFDAGASVWRYDIPSGSYTEIHRHGAGIFRVALSPDGSQVAFAEVSGKGIWTVLSVGGSAREVFKATGAETLAVWDWTRDGKALLKRGPRTPTEARRGSGSFRFSPAPRMTRGLLAHRFARSAFTRTASASRSTVGDPTWELWTMNNFLPPPANGSR